MADEDSALWLSVKADYEESQLTLKQIAAKHGVAMNAINLHRSRDGWKPRRSSKFTKQGRADDSQEPAPRTYEDMLTWAWDQLGRQLDQTEHYFAERDDAQAPGTAADRERDARTLASITRTLEKLAELRTLFEKQERDAERARNTKSVDYRAVLERRLAKLRSANAA